VAGIIGARRAWTVAMISAARPGAGAARETEAAYEQNPLLGFHACNEVCDEPGCKPHPNQHEFLRAAGEWRAPRHDLDHDPPDREPGLDKPAMRGSSRSTTSSGATTRTRCSRSRRG
jgi:hypothetical protein